MQHYDLSMIGIQTHNCKLYEKVGLSSYIPVECYTGICFFIRQFCTNCLLICVIYWLLELTVLVSIFLRVTRCPTLCGTVTHFHYFLHSRKLRRCPASLHRTLVHTLLCLQWSASGWNSVPATIQSVHGSSNVSKKLNDCKTGCLVGIASLIICFTLMILWYCWPAADS